MKPTLTIRNAVIYQGNNLDVLPTLDDNSVDAIVCDPPYELGFMGKSWDSSGIAYSVELWRECLRVLKPGGYLLAFGGTRTWHRLAVAVEDAGFEIRDNIAWLYGSGFPKSHNISKAIDKLNGKHEIDLSTFGNYVKELRQAKGLSRKELDDLMGTTTAVSWWEGRASGVVLPSKETYNRLKEIIEMDNRFDCLIDWAEAEREIIGKYATDMGGLAGERLGQSGGDITAPATDDAKAWDGWGTALKPAHEPIVVARKPLTGTVAQNVLEHGVGGLNIDATRIQGADALEGCSRHGGGIVGNGSSFELPDSKSSMPAGRWPANIILDEYTAELIDEQSGVSKSPSGVQVRKAGSEFGQNTGWNAHKNKDTLRQGHADSGGASRFFYVAKASKRDRNEGLDELPEVRHSDRNATDGVDGDNPRNRTNQAKQNFHPTVKPTALMQYLIRLVTPANGVVLDPFAGSGSTGKAAILENKHFIGIELTPEYLPIIEGRLQHAYETLDSKQDE